MKKIPGIFSLLASVALLQGCIENDIPYPQLVQSIQAIAAEGESKSAYIDSIAYEVNVYLGETVDIQKVRFTEYQITPGATSDPDLLQGTYNLSTPLTVTLSRYQDYNWTINAVQEIERYFQIDGEVGESDIDPVGHRVIVRVPEGTDLSDLRLQRIKLGPEGITTMVPDLQPGTIDLSQPLQVKVTCWGRTETWTIYAEISETIVSTTSVDAWSMVIWAYGNGPSDVQNTFQYRKTSSTEWTDVPVSDVTQTAGAFSCCIKHLEPLTEYAVRTVSGKNMGNEVKVTTGPTADIPDGDFENWWFKNNRLWCPWAEGGTPYWDTGNPGSVTLGQNLTQPTDYTPTGSGKAAQCTTKFVGIAGIGKLGAGSIFTGVYARTDGTNGVLNMGRPWTIRPTRLHGYFRYNAKDIDYASTEFKQLIGRPDSCQIYVALTDWNGPYEIRTNPKNRQLFDPTADYIIAYGELIYSGQMDSYQEFTIELNYKSTSRVPTCLQITCCASKLGDYYTGGNGSVLYVDQFWFDWDY